MNVYLKMKDGFRAKLPDELIRQAQSKMIDVIGNEGCDLITVWSCPCTIGQNLDFADEGVMLTKWTICFLNCYKIGPQRTVTVALTWRMSRVKETHSGASRERRDVEICRCRVGRGRQRARWLEGIEKGILSCRGLNRLNWRWWLWWRRMIDVHVQLK